MAHTLATDDGGNRNGAANFEKGGGVQLLPLLLMTRANQ